MKLMSFYPTPFSIFLEDPVNAPFEGNLALPLAQRARDARSSAIREILKVTLQPDVISFAGGLPAPESFPVDPLRAAFDKVLREVGPASLQYSTTEGHPHLREWVAARETLTAHAARMTDGDRGLALALAGDPAGGIALLSNAARDPAATATMRQNLALALALDGRWVEARTVASVDMSPEQVDARLVEWAGFARPQSAAQQVAALLGVTPAIDRGQPVQLALAAPGDAAPVAQVAVEAVDVPSAPEPAPAVAPR